MLPLVTQAAGFLTTTWPQPPCKSPMVPGRGTSLPFFSHSLRTAWPTTTVHWQLGSRTRTALTQVPFRSATADGLPASTNTTHTADASGVTGRHTCTCMLPHAFAKIHPSRLTLYTWTCVTRCFCATCTGRTTETLAQLLIIAGKTDYSQEAAQATFTAVVYGGRCREWFNSVVPRGGQGWGPYKHWKCMQTFCRASTLSCIPLSHIL
jgi:hypothetical protein